MTYRYGPHRLYVGDNYGYLARFRSRLFRCALLDPPYNIGVKYHDYHDALSDADYLGLMAGMLTGVRHTLADDGSAFLLADKKYFADLQLVARDVGFRFHGQIIWAYAFGQYRDDGLTPSHTPIAWLAKSRSPAFFPDSVRVQSVRQKLGDKRANPAGRVMGDVWTDIPRLAGTHKERIPGVPTQLPLKLVRRLFAMTTATGDVVLDPFAGSATALVAAHQLGRRSVGIELSERVAAIAAARLERELGGAMGPR
jgi:DNA modification methylase